MVARLVASEHVQRGGRSGEGHQHIPREFVGEINVEVAQPPGKEQRHIEHRLVLRAQRRRHQRSLGQSLARTPRVLHRLQHRGSGGSLAS